MFFKYSEYAMTKYALLMISALALSASPMMAQSTTGSEIDCDDEAYKDDEACLVYLPAAGDVNNFVPLVPVAAGILIVAAAGGGSSTTSTGSTGGTAGATGGTGN